MVISVIGCEFIFDNGRKVIDVCGGVVVVCLGYGNEEVVIVIYE